MAPPLYAVAAALGALAVVVAVIAAAWRVLWSAILAQIPVVREIAGLPPLPRAPPPARRADTRRPVRDNARRGRDAPAPRPRPADEFLLVDDHFAGSGPPPRSILRSRS